MTTMQSSQFILGCDLGQANDFTALTIVDRQSIPTGVYEATREQRVVQFPSGRVEFEPVMRERIKRRYDLVYLYRFPLKTPYPVIVDKTKALIEKLPSEPRPRLAIDYTGVGRPVVDMFLAGGLNVPITPITITTGGKATREPDRPSYWHVPKKDLVTVLLALFQNGDIRLPKLSKFEPLNDLNEELKNFRMKMTPSANVTYEAVREGAHDDLVLSLALACWAGERISGGGLL